MNPPSQCIKLRFWRPHDLTSAFLYNIKKLYQSSVSDPYVQNEINVFASIAHTHYHGIKSSARIVRDGKEVDFLNHNNFYTATKQNYDFTKPITLKKVRE